MPRMLGGLFFRLFMLSSLSRAKWAVSLATVALVLLAVVRLSFVDGLLRRVTIDGPSMAPAFCGPHYVVPCGDCGFAFRCDAEHISPDRKAACPNCGFAENSLDAATSLAADRVLLDRWPLRFRAPKRGDVVAFRVPSGELAVKRIAALPGERLAIRDGDLFCSEQAIQRSLEAIRETRVLVHDNNFQPLETDNLPPRWKPESGSGRWRLSESGFRLDPPPRTYTGEWLNYAHWPCGGNQRLRGVTSNVTDIDSYNQGELRRPLNSVGDLMVTFRLSCDHKAVFMLRAFNGNQPIQVTVFEDRVKGFADGNSFLDLPIQRTRFSATVDVEFGLCDRQVLLLIAGRTLIRQPLEPPATSGDQPAFQLAIGGLDSALHIDDLKVWRDIYYLDPQGLSRPWEASAPLGANEFAVLGDNQPVSIDSRHWEPPGVQRRAIVGHVYRPFWNAK